MAKMWARGEPLETLDATRRLLVSLGERIGEEGDEPELAALYAMHQVIDQAMQTAINRQRATYGRSWEWIGNALGVRRQSAQERWGKKDGAA